MAADILNTIVATKYQEVVAAKQRVPMLALRALAEQALPVRPFAPAIVSRVQQGKHAVIAEVKKASPSKGLLRDPFEPAAIASSYAAHGATCLSVLTDVQYFKGCEQYLQQARAACALPVIRKDFMVDEYQVLEARAMGADAILLIAACLDDARMVAFESLAMELGLSVLVEVHDEHEMERALQLRTPLVGVNNRNLRTFEVDVGLSERLRDLCPADRVIVAESGISSSTEVVRLRGRGVHAFLVGEAFMRAPSPGQALEALFPQE
ncbi:MAG: indole-3-glycerol phosphate synthase TrpC [Pseudomonadota bacterium]